MPRKQKKTSRETAPKGRTPGPIYHEAPDAEDSDSLQFTVEQMARNLETAPKTVPPGPWMVRPALPKTPSNETETQEKISAFIARVGLKFTVTELPNEYDAEWKEASHWRCTFTHAGHRMQVKFHMGSAHTAPPTAEMVLDSVAMDVSGLENARGFEEWCGEYGYDTDSRKAERIYKQVERQAHSLKRLLPAAEVDRLLWHTERE